MCYHLPICIFETIDANSISSLIKSYVQTDNHINELAEKTVNAVVILQMFRKLHRPKNLGRLAEHSNELCGLCDLRIQPRWLVDNRDSGKRNCFVDCNGLFV